jgi:hypothetical protein
MVAIINAMKTKNNMHGSSKNKYLKIYLMAKKELNSIITKKLKKVK